MAVVSLIALLVALAVAVLVSGRPWGASTIAPRLSLAPGIGVALGDSVEAAPGRRLAVAPAQPAGGGAARPATDELAVTSGGAPRSRVSIAPAQAIAGSGQAGSPGGPPMPPTPEPAPSQPAPAPEAVPVAAPVSVSEPGTAPPTRLPTGSGSQPPGPIAGGVDPGGEDLGDRVEIQAGDELEYGFSFHVEPTAFRPPGSDNLILRIRGEASEDSSFALQLWDDGAGQRGLWSSGDAMGGERFLAPVVEGSWHDVTVHLQASSEDDGFYLLTLDGRPIDARAWISLIDSESSYARLETGLFREGESVLDPADVFFGAGQLGES
ncbi:MAG TPA: hypothetical protein VFM94_03880 [Solirubrobacterales bacterium]|nr:hypothetical protein [Solirubrobacterales bacterium]